jgi:hypothetical protein
LRPRREMAAAASDRLGRLRGSARQAEPTGEKGPDMPRIGGRYQKVVRPLCPVHGRQMLVRCVIGKVQYRYCPIPECGESIRTLRRKEPRQRQQREAPNTVVRPSRSDETAESKQTN